MSDFALVEALLVSVITLTNLALFWTVIEKASSRKLGLSFGAFILLIIIWILSAYLSELVAVNEWRLWLTKITYFSVILAFPALIKFLGYLREDQSLESGRVNISLLAPPVTLAVATLASSAIVKSITPANDSFEIVFGEYVAVYNVYVALYLIIIFYLLVSGYLESAGGRRQAYKLLITGISLFTGINVIVNVIVPFATGSQEFYRFGNYSVIFFTALTTYAVVAHKLFEIRTFATAVLAALINIFLISRIFLSQSIFNAILNTVISLIVGFGSYILVKNIAREISRREEIEKLAKERIVTLHELEQRNKNLATLQKISELVLNEIELKPMAQKILDEIPKQLDNCHGALLNLTKEGHLAAFSFSANEFSRKIFSLVGDLEKYSYPIRRDFNLLHKTLVDRQPYESADLSNFISPPITKTLSLTLQKLIGIRHVLAVPLYAGQEPLGIMMFAYKVSAAELTERDRDMARAIADDMSLAIQRAYAYQKLKDANEYLADLDKLKDEFISMASHELNTPLAAIEGYLSMILDEGLGRVDPRAKEYLRRAYDSSKRLAELILDLLNVSRIEQGRLKMKFAKVNLIDLAQSVVNELQIKADAKKLYLKLEAKKSAVPDTWADPDRIREVFVNLLGNALKFTEKGGVTIRIAEDTGKLKTEIADTGRGIRATDQNKLFQKFTQIKREQDEHQGTGLGLYISKNFVELHKGRIFVKSEEGKGATFIFELPILKEAPKKVEGAILETPISASTVEAAPTPAVAKSAR